MARRHPFTWAAALCLLASVVAAQTTIGPPLYKAQNLGDVANPATARTNLGAAKSGANSDITSLNGLTTPVAINEGGTGATTAPAARTALGLDSAATQPSSAFDPAGAAATAAAAALAKAANLSDVASSTTARANLGAAKSGSNSDITAITGLTTPLAIAQGGVGAKDAATALQNLAGVVNASACGYASAPSWCAGSDIGAWINAAVAYVGTGKSYKVIIDPYQDYSYSTTAVVPYNILLDCQGAMLNYTPTTGAAIVAAEPTFTAATTYTMPTIRDCRIHHSAGYSAGNTNIGVYSGGDPAGALSPSTYWGPFLNLQNVDISGFKSGYTYGNNVWAINLTGIHLHDNYDGIFDPGGQDNAGELMKVSGFNIYDNAHCGVNSLAYNNWGFENGHFDYNGSGGTTGAVCGTQIVAEFHFIHFEQPTAPYIYMSSAASVIVDDSTIYTASNTTAGQGLFVMLGSGHIYNASIIHNIQISGQYTPPYLVYTGGVGDTLQSFSGIQYNSVPAGSSFTTPYSDAVNGAIAFPNSGPLNIGGDVAIGYSGIAIGSGTGFSGAPAPSNGLAVQGSVGIGTNTPAYPLDVDNKTAASDITARVHNGVSGRAAIWLAAAGSNYVNSQYAGTGATWGVGEFGSTAFQFQDITNGTYPLVINQGAPTNAINIGPTGFIGLGRIPTYNFDAYAASTLNADANSAITNAASGRGAYFLANANSNYSNTAYFGTGAQWRAGQIGSTMFQIEDVTSSTFPFSIVQGAPTNAVNITSNGFVGLGRGPIYNFDVYQSASSATDAVIGLTNAASSKGAYLNLTGASNYISSRYYGTGATWAVGEFGTTAFQVQDITSGTTPLTIAQGAPSNALYVAANGKIGIGRTPSFNLDLYQSAAGSDAIMAITNGASTNGAYVRTYTASTNYSGADFAGLGQEWRVGQFGNTAFQVNDITNSTIPLKIAAAAPTGSFSVDAFGNVFVNRNSAVASTPSLTDRYPVFVVEGASLANSALGSINWASDPTSGSLNFAKARGASVGYPSVITTGDLIGQITAAGYDGTTWSRSVQINFSSSGTIASGVVPGLIDIQTANASGTLAPALHIANTQNVSIGTSTESASRLLVSQPSATAADMTVTFTNLANGKAAFLQTIALSNYSATRHDGTGQVWYEGEFGSTAYVLYDSTNNKTPFSVAANAPNNALTVSSAGLVNVPGALTVGGVLTSGGAAITPTFSATTSSIGGSALSAGTCASTTATVTGATTSMAVVVTPATYPGDAFYWHGYVSAAGVVTVKVCAATGATPTASTYNVRVLQ